MSLLLLESARQGDPITRSIQMARFVALRLFHPGSFRIGRPILVSSTDSTST